MCKLKLLLLACLVLGACASETVKPWERGNLAKDVMLKSGSAQHAAFEAHRYLSKESNAGSSDMSGGGCGCN